MRLALTRATKWYKLGRSRPSTQARRKQIHQRERSVGVREAFHRERGGGPKASSTRRRACTGGQRQSYKRVGYLTRSSGWVSQGQAGTTTEPRSSSWRDPRCFLERKEEAAAARAPRRALHGRAHMHLRAKQFASRHPEAWSNRGAWFLYLHKLVYSPVSLPNSPGTQLYSTSHRLPTHPRPWHLIYGMLFHPLYPTLVSGFFVILELHWRNVVRTTNRLTAPPSRPRSVT